MIRKYPQIIGVRASMFNDIGSIVMGSFGNIRRSNWLKCDKIVVFCCKRITCGHAID